LPPGGPQAGPRSTRRVAQCLVPVFSDQSEFRRNEGHPPSAGTRAQKYHCRPSSHGRTSPNRKPERTRSHPRPWRNWPMLRRPASAFSLLQRRGFARGFMRHQRAERPRAPRGEQQATGLGRGLGRLAPAPPGSQSAAQQRAWRGRSVGPWPGSRPAWQSLRTRTRRASPGANRLARARASGVVAVVAGHARDVDPVECVSAGLGRLVEPAHGATSPSCSPWIGSWHTMQRIEPAFSCSGYSWHRWSRTMSAA